MSVISSNQIEEKILSIVARFLNSNDDQHKIKISAASKPGDNYLGLIYDIIITNQDEKRPKQYLIIKLAPFQERYRDVFPIKEIYNREISFYENVIPEFVRVQEKKGVKHVFRPFPKHYLTSRREGEEALIMEDMKAKGFITGNHRVEPDYLHALLVMRHLGEFHALSYAMKDHEPNKFKYYEQNWQEPFYNSRMSKKVIQVILRLGNEMLKSYDSKKESLHFESLKGSLEKVGDTIRSLLEVERWGKYGVISHGGVQMKNLLFKYGDPTRPSEPTELCMIDWQSASMGSPARDIHFFIFVCTNQELRNKYYTNLLEEYYKSLSTALQRLGSDPSKLLPYDVLLDHLSDFAPYGLIMAILTIAMNMKESKDVPDLYNYSTEKAIVEEFTVIPSDRYVTRVREVVADFLKYGYKF